MSYLPPLFLLSLLLCLSSICAQQQGSFNPDVMCSLLPNNTRIKDPRACNTWIDCIDGQPVKGTCTGDLFYDRTTQQCVNPNSITCISSNPCAATAGLNGFVADPYSCNGYYYCQDGQGAHGECNAGWNFNPGTQDCIRNFPCVPKMNPDNYCNIVPDGVFIKDPANCIGYSLCWNGEVLNNTCPSSFYFNALTGVCDYPDQVDCIEPTSAPPDVSAEEVCSQAGEFASDRRSCNGYYYCKASSTAKGGIELVPGTCPQGRFFDATNGGACVPRTQIVCPYDRCVGLGSSAIELANESDDGCEGYAICQNGVKIGSGFCPSGEYFDELKQRCTTEVITFPACVATGSSTEDVGSGESPVTAAP